MRTISHAHSLVISAVTETGRAVHETIAMLTRAALRRQVRISNSIIDLNPYQMRDLNADLEGESMRLNPAFRAYEQERALYEAKQKALLFTLGMSGR
ncbi:hypothetical protein [Rhizobium rhizoryzae]|uniref:Uncharacterized protein n=1 Tax=Rhizobium rhizoryzae TaxID=451876 RepID=A0A7W6LFZ9_9HYPH|nr:hypothetical protein [Rhizobium rhizoryzae]MBB4142658.1 hypothetical protein [Rhizobium rhizoryzae]